MDGCETAHRFFGEDSQQGESCESLIHQNSKAQDYSLEQHNHQAVTAVINEHVSPDVQFDVAGESTLIAMSVNYTTNKLFSLHA